MNHSIYAMALEGGQATVPLYLVAILFVTIVVLLFCGIIVWLAVCDGQWPTISLPRGFWENLFSYGTASDEPLPPTEGDS